MGRTIPSIGNKLAEIKLAMEKGDATELELAKESYRTDLAKLKTDMLKTHYNNVSGELVKAREAQRVAQAKIDKFQYDSDIKVAETTGRWNRKTAKTKAREEGRQQTKREVALDRLDFQQENTKIDKVFALAKEHNLSPETIDALTRGIIDVDPQHQDEAIYEKLLRLAQDKKIPEATKRQFISDARKIIGIGGSTTGGAGEPPKLTQTQGNEVAFNALNALDSLRSIPVLSTDKNKSFLGMAILGGKHDEVEGRIPNETDFQNAARGMVAAAQKTGRQGLHPNLWLKSIDTEIIKARDVLADYSDLFVDGGIEFNKTPEEEYPNDLDDQDIMRDNMRDLVKAKQTIDFFDSEAGQQYLDWVGESLSESLRQDKIVYVNPPAFGSSDARSQADIDYRKERDQSMRRGRGRTPDTSEAGRTPADTSMGRWREIEAEEAGRTSDTTTTPTTPEPKPQSESGQRLPSVERQNQEMHTEIKNMSDAIAAQGWEIGNHIKYVGKKTLKLKYMKIYPGQVVRILGVASKSDGYPYDGMLVDESLRDLGWKRMGSHLTKFAIPQIGWENPDAKSMFHDIGKIHIWDNFVRQ